MGLFRTTFNSDLVSLFKFCLWNYIYVFSSAILSVFLKFTVSFMQVFFFKFWLLFLNFTFVWILVLLYLLASIINLELFCLVKSFSFLIAELTWSSILMRSLPSFFFTYSLLTSFFGCRTLCMVSLFFYSNFTNMESVFAFEFLLVNHIYVISSGFLEVSFEGELKKKGIL